MVGAFGSRMLELTAEHANAWSIAGNIADPRDSSPEMFAAKSREIDRHCSRFGRDPEEIERIWTGHVLIGENGEEYSKVRDKYGRTMDCAIQAGEVSALCDVDGMVESFIHGTPGECVDQVERLVGAGVDHFILYFLDFPKTDMMKLFRRTVVPKISAGF